RDVPARCLDFHRHRNRIPVVLDTEQNRQALVGGGVQRLPKLTLTRRAVAERDISNLIALKLDLFELAIVAMRASGGIRMPAKVASGLGASHSMQDLRPGCGGLGDDIKPLECPVRWH